MLSGEGNAEEWWKTTMGVISKIAVFFFLHDYNVKLPETS